ncbi:MAG: twin-arginine translocation signal domain-containing protein, partial [Anaerolineales bacterium]|nr:twin-arginine translocation signal domain-containing protein [Anaerolineales bacterium]
MQTQKSSSTDNSNLTRRNFLKMGASALGTLALLEVGGI